MFPHLSWARFIRPRAHCHHCCRVICEIWLESTATIISLLCGIFWSFILMVCAFHFGAMQFWWCHLAIVSECGVESALCAAPVQSRCALLLFIHSPAMCLYCMCAENSTNSNLNFSILLSATPSSLLNNVVVLDGICIHPFAASTEDDVTFIWNCIFTSDQKRVVSCWMPEWLHLASCSTMSATARSNPFPMPCRTLSSETVDNPHRPEYLWKKRMCPIYWFPLFIFIM